MRTLTKRRKHSNCLAEIQMTNIRFLFYRSRNVQSLDRQFPRRRNIHVRVECQCRRFVRLFIFRCVLERDALCEYNSFINAIPMGVRDDMNFPEIDRPNKQWLSLWSCFWFLFLLFNSLPIYERVFYEFASVSLNFYNIYRPF